ncbi:unnamed protein product [Caenorhabditis nigoni]
MKSLLLILLLFCFAYSELTKYQKDCELHMNRVRFGIAYNSKIANMNELKYDEELEKEAKKEKHDCPIGIFQEIRKNEMYSTIRVQEPRTSDHATATKVACIPYYCSDIRLMSNETLFIIDKGKEGRIRGEPGTKCPPGRKRDGSLCIVFSRGVVINGIGLSKRVLMTVLIVVFNFI